VGTDVGSGCLHGRFSQYVKSIDLGQPGQRWKKSFCPRLAEALGKSIGFKRGYFSIKLVRKAESAGGQVLLFLNRTLSEYVCAATKKPLSQRRCIPARNVVSRNATRYFLCIFESTRRS